MICSGYLFAPNKTTLLVCPDVQKFQAIADQDKVRFEEEMNSCVPLPEETVKATQPASASDKSQIPVQKKKIKTIKKTKSDTDKPMGAKSAGNVTREAPPVDKKHSSTAAIDITEVGVTLSKLSISRESIN